MSLAASLQSLQFINAVTEFKNGVASEGGACTDHEYDAYVSIAHKYIADGSHFEVNIDSRTKKEIMSYLPRDKYEDRYQVRASRLRQHDRGQGSRRCELDILQKYVELRHLGSNIFQVSYISKRRTAANLWLYVPR